MPTTIVALALSVLLGQTQTEPAIKVEPQGDNAYLLTVTLSGTTDPGAAQAFIIPRATELCGALPPRLDRYQFSASELAPGQPANDRPDSVTLIQEVRCGVSTEPIVTPRATTPPPALTQADADLLRPGIESLTDRYFSATDAGRDAEAHALASSEMTGGASVAEWAADREARLQETGAYVSRTVARITWYSNPPGVPPGYYAAVDYVAGWERQDECGYVVWHSPDGVVPFLLARQERTFLPHELDDATRAGLRRQYCILL